MSGDMHFHYTMSLKFPLLLNGCSTFFLFKVSLQPRLTDEELYELSLAREPRMHCHSVRKVVMQCSFHYILEFYDYYVGIPHQIRCQLMIYNNFILRCEDMSEKF